MISESHRQLLMTMLDFELKNHIDIVLMKFNQEAEEHPFSNIREQDHYMQVKRYFEDRIKDLKLIKPT
jgi:hypothetical protein